MRDHKTEFEELGVAVLLISFVGGRPAEAWLSQTEAPFPLLVDEKRTVYRAYGLGRSLLRVWNLRVLWTYVKLLARGRKLHPIQGDPNQLGGDFIVESDRTVRLAWPSEDPLDRPSVADLIGIRAGDRSGPKDARQPDG